MNWKLQGHLLVWAYNKPTIHYCWVQSRNCNVFCIHDFFPKLLIWNLGLILFDLTTQIFLDLILLELTFCCLELMSILAALCLWKGLLWDNKTAALIAEIQFTIISSLVRIFSNLMIMCINRYCLQKNNQIPIFLQMLYSNLVLLPKMHSEATSS